MTAIVSVRALEKSYPLGDTSVEVLTGLDLEVHPSELVAVMGPSGVGKSTLLNCIAGLDAPDRGAVMVLDRDLATMDDNARTLARRRAIGIIYQFFNLVPNLDVTENVLLPYLIDGERPDEAAVERALDRVWMKHRRDHLPSQLSGGEMQLVSIARAIARAPKLILADEPTGNVNVATGRKIMNLLAEVLVETKSAMLLVTHNPDDAARAHRVVFLQDGRIDPDASLTGDEVSVHAIHERLEKLGI